MRKREREAPEIRKSNQGSVVYKDSFEQKNFPHPNHFDCVQRKLACSQLSNDSYTLKRPQFLTEGSLSETGLVLIVDGLSYLLEKLRLRYFEIYLLRPKDDKSDVSPAILDGILRIVTL